MLTQLQTPIPLQTPKGKAWAVAIVDYGPQWDFLWVTFVHDTGECWTFRNPEIRQDKNYTFGLPKPSAIEQNPLSAPMRPNVGPSLDVPGHDAGHFFAVTRAKNEARTEQ